jgi:hypothetical protein
MPLGRFYPTVNNWLPWLPTVNSLVTADTVVHKKQYKPTWLPWYIIQTDLVTYYKQLWLACYINRPNPLSSKAHLTSLNLNNFKMI